MSDIKNIIERKERRKQLISEGAATGSKKFVEQVYELKEINRLVTTDFDSLITTIESQKEEIIKWKTSKESWEKETLFANGEIRKRDNEIVLLTKRMKDYEKQALENMVRFEDSQDVVEHLNIQIESLKAITELAVKGLKEIACLNVDSAYSAGTFARNTLSEIERLQNAQI